jgi:hypothetical protein
VILGEVLIREFPTVSSSNEMVDGIGQETLESHSKRQSSVSQPASKNQHQVNNAKRGISIKALAH